MQLIFICDSNKTKSEHLLFLSGGLASLFSATNITQDNINVNKPVV